MANKQIFQIFYDQRSRSQLQKGFLPLDNTENRRPDWYEFWVMLNHLEAHGLQEDTWYGFLSPNFTQKTGIESRELLGVVDAVDRSADVVLVDLGWDQIAYFENVWEQGEIWHPGIEDLTQHFLEVSGSNFQLSEVVSDTSTAVFGNYVIAKKAYWDAWRLLARKFFDFVEGGDQGGFAAMTTYGNRGYAPMKTFMQERFPSIILTQGNFRVVTFDSSDRVPPLGTLFPQDIQTRRLLQACNLTKSLYRTSRDKAYMEMYFKLRDRIRFTTPGKSNR